ncbi:MAG: tRNA guanosine(34) transglycosylase Tgt [Deltaproteobacteria bacterium]|nr:tRNA guanosine(34) transglycosylase Tgt [Deltaproteobacteria bacterium]
MSAFAVHTRATGSQARAGLLSTAHGAIETPVFMPVGTRGTVRTQTLGQLERLAPPMLLANTYHLLLRPGIEVFERFGGLHRWMGWTRSILTDSGGFQVFSLATSRTIDDEGAAFQEVVDGPRVVLTPERSIAMQRAIGSDVMMVLDHCVEATCEHAEAQVAMERTHRWARRSLAARGESGQLFAIVQGARFEDLRRISAAELTSIEGFDGYAIGGLAVGEERAEREDLTELVASLLPEDRPRYLMGVGTPLDILEAVHRGVDMFDCILPTAWAQHGRVFTMRGKVDLRKGLHRFVDAPLDETCECEACTRHSRSYLHHLVKAREPLGWQLLAEHNLHFYVRLMTDIRAAIRADAFVALREARRPIVMTEEPGDE